MSLRAAAVSMLAVSLALAGCSYFSTEPDPRRVEQIHAAIPRGMLLDTAESNLDALGFRCITRHGDYEDEAGTQRSAPRFLLCDQQPGRFSFSCENRDRVAIVPSATDLVADVEVSRGPNCAQP